MCMQTIRFLCRNKTGNCVLDLMSSQVLHYKQLHVLYFSWSSVRVLDLETNHGALDGHQGVNHMIGMNSTLEDRNMSGSSRVGSDRASFLLSSRRLNVSISFNLDGWRSLGLGADSRAWLWFESMKSAGASQFDRSIERVMWDRVIVAEIYIILFCFLILKIFRILEILVISIENLWVTRDPIITIFSITCRNQDQFSGKSSHCLMKKDRGATAPYWWKSTRMHKIGQYSSYSLGRLLKKDWP